MRALLVTATLALVVVAARPAAAELRGHGGPVRGLAVAPDGEIAMSGGFDAAVIRWSVSRQAALAVLRRHDGPVNAVAALPDGRFATAGEDGRVLVWPPSGDRPVMVLEGHGAPVAALAAAQDGSVVVSGSFDGSARVWPLRGGAPRILTGHAGPVTGVAVLAGGLIVSGGYDATLRIWQTAIDTPTVVTLPSPVHSLAAVPGSTRIAAGCADGRLRIVDVTDGRLVAEGDVAATPIIALAVSPDGRRIAAAGLRGAIAILGANGLRIERTLVGPGLPVWSLAFRPGTDELLTGGGDSIVRRWDVAAGEHIGTVAMGRPDDPLAAYGDDPGARVFRACVACHTLGPDDAPRAGPSLHRLFGRRIASLPGYPFSPALTSLDIVWTPATVARLFEIGPSAMTPGTKMPEQRIGSAADREALVRFLERATQ